MSSRRRDSFRGQGLVEYALILALVAVAVIVLLSVAGQAIGNIFCSVVIQMGAKVSDSIQMCTASRIMITGIANGGTVSNPVTIEAVIADNKLSDTGTVEHVTFSVSGESDRTENNPRWCAFGGDTSCSDHTLSPGPHTLKVTAVDSNHKTVEKTITFTVTGP